MQSLTIPIDLNLKAMAVMSGFLFPEFYRNFVMQILTIQEEDVESLDSKINVLAL